MEEVERGLRGETRRIALYDDPKKELGTLGRALSVGSGVYVLVVGPPGAGKTAWTDTNLVLKPILHHLKHGGIAPRFIYRSMERSLGSKLAKWYSAWLFYESGEMVEPNALLGYTNVRKRATAADIDKLRNTDFFTELQKYVDFVPGRATPKAVLDYATTSAKERGVLMKASATEVSINGELYPLDGVEVIGGTQKRYRDTQWGRIWMNSNRFFPQDQDAYTHVTDHVGKLGKDKSLIDEHSDNMADWLRDVFGFGVIDIYQLNRAIFDTYRAKNEEVTIKMSDIKGSNVPSENADVILGMLSPKQYGLKKYKGVSIESLTDEYGVCRYRHLICPKNSSGMDQFDMPIVFYGENGWTWELPEPSPMVTDQIINLRYRP